MTAVKNARRVIAQVNTEMPRTYGDTFIPVSKIDAFVEITQPLPQLKKEGDAVRSKMRSARMSLLSSKTALACNLVSAEYRTQF